MMEPNIGTNNFERILTGFEKRIRALETGLGFQLLGTLEFSSVGPQVQPAPNDSTWHTMYAPSSQTFPPGTRLIQVHFANQARATSNAACFYRLGVQWGNVANHYIIPQGYRCHNDADNIANLSMSMFGWDTPEPGYTVVRPFVDMNVDAGGTSVVVHPANATIACFA
jgi:hypothetical protein